MTHQCIGCGKILGHFCPYCNSPLTETVIHGRTWLKCEEPLAAIYFNPDNMPAAPTLCAACAEDAANLEQQTEGAASVDAQRQEGHHQ